MPQAPHTPIEWAERSYTDDAGRRCLAWDGTDPESQAPLCVRLIPADDERYCWHWRYEIEIAGRIRAEGRVTAKTYTAISVARGVMRNLVFHRAMYRRWRAHGPDTSTQKQQDQTP